MSFPLEMTLQKIGQREFFLLCGPCAAESEDLCLRVAEEVKELTDRHGWAYVFKASYKKANRLSAGSYSGPGMDEGLRILEKVRATFEVPVITDIHETIQKAMSSGKNAEGPRKNQITF